MNKYIGMALFTVFLIGSGLVYQRFYRPPEIAPIQPTGRVLNLRMRVLENQWKWDPEVVYARPGDRVHLTIFNEDAYDHGFALEAFGVNKRLFAKRETVLEFLVSKPGEFIFYCSVPCGEGHYRQTGKFVSTEGAPAEGAAASPPPLEEVIQVTE